MPLGLGVSYGTLYGRYRECFGYLRHGWNSSHYSARGLSSSSDLLAKSGDEEEEENTLAFEQLVRNSATMKHAMDPAMIAYHLPLKVLRT
jgi:hypothetical protein